MDLTPIEHLLCARHHNHYNGSEVMKDPLFFFFKGILSLIICHFLTHSLHSSHTASTLAVLSLRYISHTRISSPQFPLPLLYPT